VFVAGKMSSWIRGNMGKPENGFPPGEFNNKGEFSDSVNAKRIRTNLWPSGKFNDQDGPLSALQNSDSSMRSMSKNLSTNQTVMTLYINIPRLVVPINIPHFSETRNVSVAKCIGAGDVVFQLRYNDTMLLNGDATQITNRYMPDLVYCANLATINYLLFGIQTLLAECYTVISDPTCDSQEAFDVQWTDKKDGWRLSNDAFELARFQWYKFVNNISSNDFSNLLRYHFYDGYKMHIRANELDERKKTAYLHYVDAFLWDFINTYAKIGGIFIGSDNQGGSHYGNPNPCSFAPTDFVGVLQVAGKNFKVRNMWSACQGGTSSGDILGFKLKFFVCSSPTAPPLKFRLSSNEGTQNEQHAAVSPAMRNLGGFSLLVPAKMKRDPFDGESGARRACGAEERNDGFLQFGIGDQVSRPSNIFNNALMSACDACASVVPAPIQMYMRLGFCTLPKQNILDVPRVLRRPIDEASEPNPDKPSPPSAPSVLLMSPLPVLPAPSPSGGGSGGGGNGGGGSGGGDKDARPPPSPPLSLGGGGDGNGVVDGGVDDDQNGERQPPDTGTGADGFEEGPRFSDRSPPALEVLPDRSPPALEVLPDRSPPALEVLPGNALVGEEDPTKKPRKRKPT